METTSKLIRIHNRDNILVVRHALQAGDREVIDGKPVVFDREIKLGHKIAATYIQAGDIIYKYGVPIGSATEDIPAGAHVHLHNMKSDYIATYTLDKEFIHAKH